MGKFEWSTLYINISTFTFVLPASICLLSVVILSHSDFRISSRKQLQITLQRYPLPPPRRGQIVPAQRVLSSNICYIISNDKFELNDFRNSTYFWLVQPGIIDKFEVTSLMGQIKKDLKTQMLSLIVAFMSHDRPQDCF